MPVSPPPQQLGERLTGTIERALARRYQSRQGLDELPDLQDRRRRVDVKRFLGQARQLGELRIVHAKEAGG